MNSKKSKEKDRPRVIEKPTVNETTEFYEEQVKSNGSKNQSKGKSFKNFEIMDMADDEEEHETKKVIFYSNIYKHFPNKYLLILDQ